MPLRPSPRAAIALAAVLLATGCSSGGGVAVDPDTEDSTVDVTSPDVADGDAIATRFTCDGDDDRPAIAWSGLPDGTTTVAVVVDDPDAPKGTFTHWTAWDLDPDASPLGDVLPATVVEGTNGFGSVGYRGPCPPRGDSPHHYRFRVLALDASLDLAAGASAADVDAAVRGHVLAEGHLTATYGR